LICTTLISFIFTWFLWISFTLSFLPMFGTYLIMFLFFP
jgi:hypothetical protein